MLELRKKDQRVLESESSASEDVVDENPALFVAKKLQKDLPELQYRPKLSNTSTNLS